MHYARIIRAPGGIVETMRDRVMFVTGAGSGLGQLTAKQALSEGWKVAALDLNAAGLDELGDGPSLLKAVADITDAEAVKSAADRCEKELGPITRLVNAAAIMPLGLLTETPAATAAHIMAVNYGGMLNVVDAVLPRMLSRGSGQFVNYGSMVGHWPVMYMGAYSAAKNAVVAYTEVLYHETRHSGVRVVCVCPPIVATRLLKQAESTTWPKLFDCFPPLDPQIVVDAVEKKLLQKRGVWVFPGPLTRLSWMMRRWFPSLMWFVVHRIEKR